MAELIKLWDLLTVEQKKEIIWAAAGAGGMLTASAIFKILRGIKRWLFRKPAPATIHPESGIDIESYLRQVKQTHETLANEIVHLRSQNSRLLNGLTEALRPEYRDNFLQEQNSKLLKELIVALSPEEDDDD